jgi:hypothetical protein
MTKISIFGAGQSCRSALNSWAAQQRRPPDEVEIFVMLLDEGRLVDGRWMQGRGASRVRNV